MPHFHLLISSLQIQVLVVVMLLDPGLCDQPPLLLPQQRRQKPLEQNGGCYQLW